MTANSRALVFLIALSIISAILGNSAANRGILSEKVMSVGQDCSGYEVWVPVSFVHTRIGEVDYTSDLSLILQEVCKQYEHVEQDYIETLVTDIFIVAGHLKAGDLSGRATSQLTVWAWVFLFLAYAAYFYLIVFKSDIKEALKLLFLFAGVVFVFFFFFWVYDKTAISNLEHLPEFVYALVGTLLAYGWQFITKKQKASNTP